MSKGDLMKQNILVIGSGLYGSVVAHELAKAGYKVDIFDQRNHIGGRLGKYRYLDMSTTIECALNDVCEFIQRYSNNYDTKEVQK